MTTQTLERIGALLSEVGVARAFTARRTAPIGNLHLQVTGEGRIRLPVSRAAATRLCKLSRPAYYGQREKTLLDPSVRDTWQVPKSRVKIDKRRWNETLLPMLDNLRKDLGLPEGRRLRAEFHSLLVYEKGQFFKKHQDSEKADAMVGTLVVVLPTRFKGGTLVVEHQGEKVRYRGSSDRLTFIAFYADCEHEVQPVREGHRITLTYNLILENAADRSGDAGPKAISPLAKGLAKDLTNTLRQHFETPLPARFSSISKLRGLSPSPEQPPERLVYLLDHQYSERGIGWNGLKGNDEPRAAALLAAAEECDCEAMLALAEVHETWHCEEPYLPRHRFGRSRHWDDDEVDDDEMDDRMSDLDDPNAYELHDLIDSGVALERWVPRAGEKAASLSSYASADEVCSSTPSQNLEPYAAEFEGYMGNYGNTMDRWYRRAAIVLWPRARTFSVRARASPEWALDELNGKLGEGSIDEARQMVAALLPFWSEVAGAEERAKVFGKALRAATALADPELATALLDPFALEILTPGQARPFVALGERYGEAWLEELLAAWSDPDRRWRVPRATKRFDEAVWLASLPRLAKALHGRGDGMGPTVLRSLLRNRWQRLQQQLEHIRRPVPPRRRKEELASLAAPLLGYLQSTTVAAAEDLRGAAVAHLTADEGDLWLPCLVGLLRLAAKGTESAPHQDPGLEALRHYGIQRLRERLATPERKEDDWSFPLPPGCTCELCERLGAFLADPAQQVFEWPLAKAGRKHLHQRITRAELPVTHRTRREGRPYTLVLSKTKALFNTEARDRRAWKTDLTWLEKARTSKRKSPSAGKKRS